MIRPERVVQLRKKLGYTREQLTKVLGLRTRMTTRYWERGIKSPNLKSALKLIALAKTVGWEWDIEDFTNGGE